jgi:hypothetical protein
MGCCLGPALGCLDRGNDGEQLFGVCVAFKELPEFGNSLSGQLSALLIPEGFEMLGKQFSREVDTVDLWAVVTKRWKLGERLDNFALQKLFENPSYAVSRPIRAGHELRMPHGANLIGPALAKGDFLAK